MPRIAIRGLEKEVVVVLVVMMVAVAGDADTVTWDSGDGKKAQVSGFRSRESLGTMIHSLYILTLRLGYYARQNMHIRFISNHTMGWALLFRKCEKKKKKKRVSTFLYVDAHAHADEIMKSPNLPNTVTCPTVLGLV